MGDSSGILWKIYQEHFTWERHHEEQRASATNILVAVAGGVLAITLFLVIQGLFGALFMAKQYERFARHQHLAGKYREALNDHFRGAQIMLLRESGDREHEKEYRRLHKLRLHRLWIGLHLLIALFGVVLSVIIII